MFVNHLQPTKPELKNVVHLCVLVSHTKHEQRNTHTQRKRYTIYATSFIRLEQMNPPTFHTFDGKYVRVLFFSYSMDILKRMATYANAWQIRFALRGMQIVFDGGRRPEGRAIGFFRVFVYVWREPENENHHLWLLLAFAKVRYRFSLRQVMGFCANSVWEYIRGICGCFSLFIYNKNIIYKKYKNYISWAKKIHMCKICKKPSTFKSRRNSLNYPQTFHCTRAYTLIKCHAKL